MSTELVTAHAGKNHVDASDIGALYAGALGGGRYALDVGEGLAVSMTDANTLHIGTGGFIFDGRWVRVTDGGEDVKIANGSQGAYRKDLVTYTYTRDPSSGNIEEGKWGVAQGSAASKESDAKVPAIEEGDILDGALTATCAVAEVDLAGLTPTAKLLLPSVASLKSLGDSVSPKFIRLDRSIVCCIAGGICIISVDFLTIHAANTMVKIGTLPDGLKPVGQVGMSQIETNKDAYIAPLRFRGDNSAYGQLMVSNAGNISVYTNRSGSDYAYFYGQLVFPVTRS